MARIKGAMATRKRRKKVLKAAKGYYGGKHRLFKTAKQAVMKSGQYAYIGRKDHPYLCCLQGKRYELLHLYERSEEGRRGPEQKDAV